MKTDTVKNFLIKAEHDLKSAELIIKSQPDYTDTITFHCQQTIEKVLKAFLTFHKVKIKSNHDILFLLEECKKIDTGFKNFSFDLVSDINEIGMSVRYDDIENDPKQKEAFLYLELAREIFEFVNLKLSSSE